MFNKFLKKFIPLFFFLFLSHMANGNPLDSSFKQWLTNEMQAYQTPGVSIAIIKNYKIEWAEGFGVANKTTRQPVTINTLFQAGSISKPVTAMAALRTVQDGKLSLDQNINRYLVTWLLHENQFTKNNKVTLRKLLDHSAGISVHGFIGYARGQSLPTASTSVKWNNTSQFRSYSCH